MIVYILIAVVAIVLWIIIDDIYLRIHINKQRISHEIDKNKLVYNLKILKVKRKLLKAEINLGNENLRLLKAIIHGVDYIDFRQIYLNTQPKEKK